MRLSLNCIVSITLSLDKNFFDEMLLKEKKHFHEMLFEGKNYFLKNTCFLIRDFIQPMQQEKYGPFFHFTYCFIWLFQFVLKTFTFL